MPIAPTAFQEQCLQAVRAELQRLGHAVDFGWTEGKTEGYYLGRVDPTGKHVEVYIYEDEAGFHARGRWHPLEAVDFDAPADLVARLLQDLAAELQ